MGKQSFQIGDKVRFISIENSHGYDVGIGEVMEIFTDSVWDDEENILIETGNEMLQVFFPKLSVTFTFQDDKFIHA